jgi:hypothetical protein
MKYIKTFESFDHNITNEGWLWGEGSIWSKIGNWISNWKNKKMAEGAEAFNAWAEKNPEKIEEMKVKLKPEFDKLSDKDKEELVSKLENYKGEEPPADVVEAAEEVAKVEEKLKRCKEGTRIYESNSLILEEAELSLGRKILKWLGLGMQYLGMFTIAMSFITYFATAMFAAAGISAVAIAVGPWLILGAFIAGAVVAFTGVYAQYKANTENPDFKQGNYKSGWESSGRGIM